MKQPHFLFRAAAIASSGLLVTGLVFFRAGVLHNFQPKQAQAVTSTDGSTVNGDALFDWRPLLDLDDAVASQRPFVAHSDSPLNAIQRAESNSYNLALDLLDLLTIQTQETMMAGSKAGVLTLLPSADIALPSANGIELGQPHSEVKDRSRDALRPLTIPPPQVMSGSKNAVGVIPDSWFLPESKPDFYDSVIPLESEQLFTLPTFTTDPR